MGPVPVWWGGRAGWLSPLGLPPVVGGLGVGAVVFVVFGANLLVREAGIGRAERAVVLVREVQVRSAPADQDDLTLFRVPEGTAVRTEDRAGSEDALPHSQGE